MNTKEQIIEIITREKTMFYSQNKAEKELFILLKKLTDDDKKSLKPQIVKLLRKYNKETFNVEGSDYKYQLACTAGFIMLNYSEYKSHWGTDYDKILDWYCPRWFSEYYNNKQWMSIGYDRLIEYINKGYLTPSANKIAHELVELKNDYDNFHKITLTEHIWTLFQYESEVHLTQRYPKFGKIAWKSKLLELVKDKQIDRNKLLSECLSTSSRNFNKIVVGFFFDLFLELEASDDELLNLQDSLYLVLQSSHSKPIKQTLKYIQRIHKAPDFNLAGVMEQIPLLLSWDIKSVVIGTLSLIDTLLKAYSQHKEALGLLIVQTLGQEDESLQTQAIKLLAKHKLLKIQSILDEINIYAEGIYYSTKKLLPTLDKTTVKEETLKIVPLPHLREDNRIPSHETFDELVFFFSQVFEGHNVYDFDLFMLHLPKLKQELTKDNISKLEPAFQRAIKLYAGKYDELSNHSNIIVLMAVVFLEFALYLKNKFTNTLINIEKDYRELMSFFSTYGTRTSWSAIMELEEAIGYPTEVTNISLNNSRIEKNIQKRKDFGYVESTYAQLLLHMLNSEFTFTTISTVTHTPCWIEASVLINRIKDLHENSININLYDMQIALSRVIISSDDMDTSKLDKEFKNLFNYLSCDIPLDITQVKRAEFWLVAILRKNNKIDAKNFTDSLHKDNSDTSILTSPNWYAYKEAWEYEDWEKGVKVKKTIMSPKFTIERKRIVENLPFESIFKHSSLGFYNISASDCCSYLYASPTIPKFLLQNLIVYLGKGYSDANTVRVLEAVSLALIEIWDDFGEIEYIFLAFIITYETKSTRQLASELWIKATSQGSMNHKLLGETLGKLEHKEYAPLKRFTDLVISSMLNISSLHNKGLHLLLSNMIIHMNYMPIKGTKKLLEIYLEVLSLTKVSATVETLGKLRVWAEVKSLNSIINKILRY